jgi:membrane fusion protein (multidrug efflux system)
MKDCCLVALLLLLTAPGCSKPGASAVAKPAASAAEPVPVTVVRAELVPLDRSLPIVGTLYAKDEATIAAEVEGRVEVTRFELGDRVKEGQELALIDTGSYAALAQQAAARLAQAQAAATNADGELRRQLALESTGIASPADLDTARAGAESARANVAASVATAAVAQLNLAHSHVLAPFDGAVAERLVTKGDFMEKGKPMFRLVNDEKIKFIAQAPEAYAAQVQRGQTVEFTVDAFPGERFTGEIFLISPQVNTSTRAFPLGALVDNPDRRLKANTFARGEIILARAVPTLMVPLDAVVSVAGSTRVFTLDGMVARDRPVKLGRVRGGRQEVLEGLKPGELVVTSGGSRLSDGRQVALRSGLESNPPTTAATP